MTESDTEPVVAIGEEVLLRHELSARDGDSRRRKMFLLVFGLAPLAVANVGVGLGLIYWGLATDSGHWPLILAIPYLLVFAPVSIYQFSWMMGALGWIYPLGRREILRPGELEVRTLARSCIYSLKDAELTVRRKGYLGLVTIRISSGHRRTVLRCITSGELKIIKAYHQSANRSNFPCR